MDRSVVTALLGPTNTGKTHRAIERMLAHDSGAIGLPLRLLAREVYDRVAQKVGAERVALVTGEERRVPRAPSYWISTTEAMSTEREVDFVAVDEVQLMEDRERGHVFTDRVLHARGRKETCFLGSHAARELLFGLVPHATLEPLQRLSRLSHAGASALKKLPARSAIVAFSMAEVVENAERAKARGGAAVVLGALSPRARNAQVAMFQAGEVDTLVATDAIGMGLNLDVRHVAFAKLRKFDGQKVRDLEIAEVAQIAGRAGRYVTDGTFGSLAPFVLPLGVVRAVEQHLVPSIRRARFRARPSFGSLAELAASLSEAPRSPWLVPTGDVDDVRALRILAASPEVRARAVGEDHVRLLWDVCAIPDYRKLLFESHAAFLGELYAELCARGPVGPAFLGAFFPGLTVDPASSAEDLAADVDTLVARIAHVRLLSYIAQKPAFVREATTVAARAAAWEDRLSDALHAALVARFVHAGTKPSKLPSRPRGREPRAPAGAPFGAPPAPASSPFAGLALLRARLDAGSSHDLHDAGARGVVEAADEAPFEAFSVSAEGAVTLGEANVARLVRGRKLHMPAFRLDVGADLRAGEKLALERRMTAFVVDLGATFVRALSPLPPDPSPPLRGLVYRLTEGLGSVDEREALAEIAALTAAERSFIEARGVVMRPGAWFVDVSPHARFLRRVLVLVHTGERPRPDDPTWGSRAAFPRAVSPLVLGYWKARGVWVRGDLAAPPEDALAGRPPLRRGSGM